MHLQACFCFSLLKKERRSVGSFEELPVNSALASECEQWRDCPQQVKGPTLTQTHLRRAVHLRLPVDAFLMSYSPQRSISILSSYLWAAGFKKKRCRSSFKKTCSGLHKSSRTLRNLLSVHLHICGPQVAPGIFAIKQNESDLRII